MNANLKLQIEREILENRNYLNNFHGHLPGGYKRGLDSSQKSSINDAIASERRRDQTRGEFWATIDTVIQELGIQPEAIIQARNKLKPTGITHLILPIYIRLRELGYNHYPDLTQ